VTSDSGAQAERETQKSRSTFTVERLFHWKSQDDYDSLEREPQLVSLYVVEALELRNLEILLCLEASGWEGV
jgi:hypothetical protein